MLVRTRQIRMRTDEERERRTAIRLALCVREIVLRALQVVAREA